MHDSDLPLLRCLMLKGQARIEIVCQALDLPAAALSDRLGNLSSAGLCEQTKLGWRLTPAGRSRVEDGLRAERDAAGQDSAEALYADFLPLNASFKQIAFDWQMRSLNGESIANDHSDAAYDEAVIARLAAAHETLRAYLTRVAALASRFCTYEKRFETALQRLRAGERRYFAAPLIDSYHTVWFELHEDLISLAGLTRAQEAAKGHGA